MKPISNVIDTKAFIAYSYAHKQFQEAYNLVTKLYAKQKREHTGVKYISHPSTVASLLLDYDMQPATMVAALLEETLKRTALKAATIKDLFGADVLALVQVLTPPKAGDDEALKAYCDGLRAAGYQAQTIKIVSLLDHVVAIPANRLSASVSQLNAALDLLPYLEGGNQELLGRLRAALRRALS